MFAGEGEGGFGSCKFVIVGVYSKPLEDVGEDFDWSVFDSSFDCPMTVIYLLPPLWMLISPVTK